jgi:hypothetical protein
VRKIRTIVDSAPGPRARLLEDFINERTLLEQAVAARPAQHGAMTSATPESHL